MIHLLAQADPSDTLGWVQTLLTNLGVWDTISNAVAALVVIAISSAVLRFIR